MISFHSTDEIDIRGKAAVTFGNFDGLHRGHTMLINEVLKYSDLGLNTVCVSLITDGKVLLTEKERNGILSDSGIDYDISLHASKELYAMPAEQFIEEILIGKLNTKIFVTGEDFRFGKDRSGSVDTLKAAAEKYGFELKVLPEEQIGGERVSSTKIRSALSDGNVRKVAAYSGRPYRIEGEVVHGRGLAKTLGYPTMNIVPGKDKFLPRFGVYYVKVFMDGEQFDGMANLGVKPTITDENIPLLEIYLMNRSDDFYGKYITAEFMDFIRPEMKFDSLDALKASLQDDLYKIAGLIKGENSMLEKIREILVEQLNIDPEDVTETSSFREDLGVDSLDLFELVMNLEEEYGFEIPGEELQNLETVGSVIDYLKDNGIDA